MVANLVNRKHARRYRHGWHHNDRIKSDGVLHSQYLCATDVRGMGQLKFSTRIDQLRETEQA